MIPDLIADIIAAHANGGITRDQALATYEVPDVVAFSSMLNEADPGAYQGLIAARREHRPPSTAEARSEALTAAADPATNDAFDELTRLLRLVDAMDAERHQHDDEGWPIATRPELLDVLDGRYERPLPALLMRSDGLGLFYAGKVNSLAGEPGGGKTWLALAAVVEVINSGRCAMFIDFEDRIDGAVRRLVQLGATRDAILGHFRYVSPTLNIKDGGLPTNVVDATEGTSLVVIDSMGEALAHAELNQNNDDEVSKWMNRVARRLADNGAGVILLDHVTKSSDDRGRWAIGSQRKLASIDGVAYMANTLKAAAVGAVGHITLKCSKDRQGNYQHGTDVADIHLHDDAGDMRIEIEPPPATTESGEKPLTGYMERVSRFIESDDEGWTKAAIHGSVEGGRPHIDTALRQLQEAGYIDVVKGARNSVIHRSIKPFRESEWPTSAPRHDLGTTSARRGEQALDSDLGTSAPPRRGAEVRSRGAGVAETDSKTSTSAPPSAEVNGFDPDFPF